MKTTKILVLVLCLAFLNGCSDDNFIEESTIIQEKALTESKTSFTNKVATGVIPSQLSFELSGDPDDTVYATSIYKTGNTSIKTTVRNNILNNNPGSTFTDLGNNKDLFKYTIATSPSVHSIISGYHQNLYLIESINPTAIEVTFFLSVTTQRREEIRNEVSNAVNSEIVEIINLNGEIETWIFNKCCIAEATCEEINNYSTEIYIDNPLQP